MSFEWQPTTTAELIPKLEEHTNLKPRGRAFKNTFPVRTHSGTLKTLVSWKFNEWDYGKPHKIQLPSHARGLFTLDNEIVVRGYDKFFNVDEVRNTQWNWLEKNTKGPYVVTAKENGCIIFFSGLKDGTILVCSKHSYGKREDGSRSHAVAGEEALTRQLKEKGITVEEFAKMLWEMKCTAVAELCDDSFEEHVVEYSKDRSGLYLHGLNTNQPIFETRPMEEVEAFALKYGFKPTEYLQKSNIHDLKTFLEECAKTGSYNGRESEGFVIRTHMTNENNNDLFFKFKFEEPYLMYRQWREVTREYINTRNRADVRISKHRYITNKYLDFVIPLLDSDKSLREEFLKGFGIISLRKKFLQDYGMSGSEILSHEKIQELEELNTSMEKLTINEDTKFVIVPIATIGCGKTTTAMTITECFPDEWSLVINDDIPNGKTGPTEFVKRGLTHLKEGKKAVFLDRNNHQFRERQQIIDTVRRLKEDYIAYNNNLQFVCLNFVGDDSTSDELWEVTRDRVFKRGDNHQSIKAASDDPEIVEKIMKGFIGRFQPCTPSKDPDAQFDLIIDLQVGKENSSLDNAKKVLTSLHEKYPLLVKSIPSESSLESSFEKALAFKPTFTKTFGGKNKNKGTKEKQQRKPEEKTRTPVYYSLKVPHSQLLALITERLQDTTSILQHLQLVNRIQDEFHVTTCHMNQARRGTDREKSVWEKYRAIESMKQTSGEPLSSIYGDLTLKSIVWDEKAMCVVVKDVKFVDKLHPDKELMLEIGNEFIHITIGTADESIKPFYSNQLAKMAMEGKEGVHIVELEDVIIEHAVLEVNY